MEKQDIRICCSLGDEPARIVRSKDYDRLFILTDENTELHSLPLLREALQDIPFTPVSIPAGDLHKNIDTLSSVWTALSQGGASRKSLLLNLGGGMVTDLGGFAAATFKRGIRYANLPTTLLSMVDAAVGGKTGINFCGLKNEVGAFCPADTVLICTQFLHTLDRRNLASGYAEMLKHGLISTRAHWAELLKRQPGDTSDAGQLTRLIEESVRIKERIVSQDPYEKGLRKALNLGHTVGHAFESFTFHTDHPALHGYAVAWGLVCELYLSARLTGFPTEALHQTTRFIHEHWGHLTFSCDDYPALYSLMLHDKKNTGGTINFTLLRDIGDIALNQTAGRDLIYEALDYYRETCE